MFERLIDRFVNSVLKLSLALFPIEGKSKSRESSFDNTDPEAASYSQTGNSTGKDKD